MENVSFGFVGLHFLGVLCLVRIKNGGDRVKNYRLQWVMSLQKAIRPLQPPLLPCRRNRPRSLTGSSESRCASWWASRRSCPWRACLFWGRQSYRSIRLRCCWCWGGGSCTPDFVNDSPSITALTDWSSRIVAGWPSAGPKGIGSWCIPHGSAASWRGWLW